MSYEDFIASRAKKKTALDAEAQKRKAAKRQTNRMRGVMGFAHLMMFATFLVAAWSAFDLVSAINGVPTEVAFLAFAAVEGTWAACVLVMVMWQHDIEKLYQFDKANELANQAFWVSLVLNFAHGFTLVGVAVPSASWAALAASIGDLVGGALAGVALCVFPYMFKRLFAVLVTNQVEEARALNLGDALTERYERTAFERLNPAELGSEPEQNPAELGSAAQNWGSEPGSVGTTLPPVVPVPAVQNPVPVAENSGSAEQNSGSAAAEFGLNVSSRTELLNKLIVQDKVKDTATLRAAVADAGFSAPSDSYIRRLVREANN